MRIVFVGASDLTVETAERLVKRGHEVVIIDQDRDKIKELGEQLDCGFLHGDGSRPHLLDEAGPEHTDFLFCLTDNDRDNILAALVGRSLGFTHVVVQIHDAEYLTVCHELNLEHTIIPSRTIARYLADMVAGVDMLELSSLIKGEARFMMFEVDEETRGKVGEVELPDEARIICLYRDEEFLLPDEDTTLKVGDEVVVLTHSRHLAELTKKFQPETRNGDGD